MAAEVLIGLVDSNILLEYLDLRLRDGFTTYKYNELIEKGREALNVWEVKLKIQNKIEEKEDLNKEEAIEYLGIRTERQLRHLRERYNIKMKKNEKGVNLYSLAELIRVKAIAPTLRNNPQ
jgi:hypothetical protein